MLYYRPPGDKGACRQNQADHTQAQQTGTHLRDGAVVDLCIVSSEKRPGSVEPTNLLPKAQTAEKK